MDEEIKNNIIVYLQNNEQIPIEYETFIFPTTKKEYELKYAGKERKEIILSDTMSVPFQAIKHFGKIQDGDWTNMLIFGDNLQALKHLLKLKNEGKLKNSDGTDGVKLVYIDPPFASRQDFKGSKEQKAYQDKIAGAMFIEFLRKRLIFLKEIMASNSTIYVHLDYRKCHYIKVIMDEIFGENNFKNEIVWCYGGGAIPVDAFPRKHDVIFRYTLGSTQTFNKIYRPYSEGTAKIPRHSLNSGGESLDLEKGTPINDWWSDISSLTSYMKEWIGYPTQKPEKLIGRIIEVSTNPGDIVLDCFAGSGTTAAVAEKLNRRWIVCDCGKLAIYTIQKRMLNLKEEIGNNGKDVKLRRYVLYNAGLYQDGELLKQMQEEEYKNFVLELFGCQKRKHLINGLEMHGTLNNYSVMIFNNENFLTEAFINELHNTLGKFIKDKLFLIAPVGVVGFNQDYIKIENTEYTILRIPNSIIGYIKDKNFKRIEQPRSSSDINQTIDSVGFDFIWPPNVVAEYFFTNPKDKLVDTEYVIKIKEFEPIQIGSNIVEFEDPKSEALALVMIDLDYDGETFNLDNYYFGDEICKNGFNITFDDKIGNKLMIIYMDIFGNEKKEVLTKNDFVRA